MLTQQRDEAGKHAIFRMFVCLMYSPMNRTLKKEAVREFYIWTIFKVEEKMIGFTPGVLYDRAHTTITQTI